MFRLTGCRTNQLRVKRFNVQRMALLAVAAAAAVPTLARATLTISLQLAPGAAGAADTNAFLSPSSAGQDIPIYVYATVTGQNVMSPVPSGGSSSTAPSTTNGDFDGIQFAYYNITNSITGSSNGLIDTASGFSPTLNTLGGTGFAANGSQPGLVQNVANGISVGSSNLSDPSTGVAFARAGSGVYDNYFTFNAATQTYTEYGNDSAGDIYLSNGNKSASFLLETLYFKPSFTASTFTASTPSSKISTTFSISPVNFPSGSEYHDANWFEDLSGQPSGGNPPSSVENGSYSAGTSVTFYNTLGGDANDDGVVNVSDLAILATNYGTSSGATWSQGDFTGDGAVNVSDLAVLATDYGQSLTGASNSDDPDFATALSDVNWPGATPSVPEPRAALAAILASAMLLSGRARRTPQALPARA